MMDHGGSKTDGTTPKPSSAFVAFSQLSGSVTGHEQRLDSLEGQRNQAFSQLLARLDQLDLAATAAAATSTAAAVPTPPPPPVAPPVIIAGPELNLTLPRPYEGDFELCCGFLSQCDLIFRYQPSRYSTGGAQVAFIMSLLTGQAL